MRKTRPEPNMMEKKEKRKEPSKSQRAQSKVLGKSKHIHHNKWKQTKLNKGKGKDIHCGIKKYGYLQETHQLQIHQINQKYNNKRVRVSGWEKRYPTNMNRKKTVWVFSQQIR